jgi:hypothetical protein
MPNRSYREKNRDRLIEYDKKYRSEHPNVHRDRNKKKDAEYTAKWRMKNPGVNLSNQKKYSKTESGRMTARRHAIKQKGWYGEYKKTLCCEKCGERDPICLDFHHVGIKTKSISQMVNAGSVEDVMNEISQCIVVCSNCHRKLHRDIRDKKKLIGTDTPE